MSKIEQPLAPQSAVLTRRNMLLGGAMIATAGIAWAREPVANEPRLGDRSLDDVVPKAFGSWRYETASGLVLPPPDQMRDEIYSDLLTRVYSSTDGTSVMLLIAYSGAQDGVLQVHRPEVCYPASGFTLTHNEERMLDLPDETIPTRYMVAEGGGRLEQLTYWTRLGDSFPTSWLGQRIDVVRANLRREIPDGVLVRVSTNAPDTRTAQAILDGFSADFVRALPPAGRAVMLG